MNVLPFNILQSMECTLLRGKYVQNEPVPALYNHVYRFWKDTWRKVFTEAGSPESLNAENFLRQDVIIALHRKEVIVGMVTKCLYNLSADAIYDHPYMIPFPATLIQPLKSLHDGIMTTEEYLCVDPAFRKSAVGVSLSEVLIGLGLNVFQDCGAANTIATSVRPAGVHQMAAKFGYQELGSFKKYGLDCVLIHNSNATICEHQDSQVRELVRRYWANRNDLALYKEQLSQRNFKEVA